MDQELKQSSSPDSELARRSGDRRSAASHNQNQPAVERRRGDRRSKPGLKALVEQLLGRD
jgi:hypothetical protein